jgi:hypothetical protein
MATSRQFGIPNHVDQTDVFFIDKNGALNVVWAVGEGVWTGPKAISATHVAPPGAPVTASNQFGIPDQTDVFFVDNSGALNVAWIGDGHDWAGPAAISSIGVAPPGAAVAASRQFGISDQTDVFFVGNDGALNVAWVVGRGQWAWQPRAISAPNVARPGAPVATSNQFGLPDQTDVFFVGRNGALNVAWVVGRGEWWGPNAISAAGVVGGEAFTGVAASQEF